MNPKHVDYKSPKSPFETYDDSNLKPYKNLNKLQKLPGLYEESSSDIWLIDGLEYIDRLDGVKSAVVKAFNKQVSLSSFWLGMYSLFNLKLCQSYQNAHFSYTYLSKITVLRIPNVYDYLNSDQACAVVLEELAGRSLSSQQVNNSIIQQLCELLTETHSHSVESIGLISNHTPLNICSNQLEDWQSRLKLTINELVGSMNQEFKVSPILNRYLNVSLDEISKISLSKIVPLMMDLRWDQFAEQEGVVTGIYDLDCFVFAPIELDFVILEYLLTTEQLTLFVEQYRKAMNGKVYIPDLTNVRNVYRMLLFLMNVLGEDDIEKWMAQPCFFNGNHS